jgi:hypothetical protein
VEALKYSSNEVENKPSSFSDLKLQPVLLNLNPNLTVSEKRGRSGTVCFLGFVPGQSLDVH